jgi:hypothetical protein
MPLQRQDSTSGTDWLSRRIGVGRGRQPEAWMGLKLRLEAVFGGICGLGVLVDRQFCNVEKARTLSMQTE